MVNDNWPKTWLKKDVLKLKRRKNRRLPCHSSLTGLMFLPQTAKTLDVGILDLSTNGVGVLAPEEVEVGQEVIVKLMRTRAISLIPFHAEVLQCTSKSEHCFRISCHFKEPIDSVLWEYLVG